MHCNSLLPWLLIVNGGLACQVPGWGGEAWTSAPTLIAMHAAGGEQALCPGASLEVVLHRSARHPPPHAVLQLVLSPLLVSQSYLAAAVSCTLYVAGASSYLYITFLGYSVLPGLNHTVVRGVGDP